jgi:hypothetical protein
MIEFLIGFALGVAFVYIYNFVRWLVLEYASDVERGKWRKK